MDTILIQNPKAIQNYRITTKQQILENSKFTSIPIKTAALNNQQFFIVWENGILQLWDLQTSELLKQSILPDREMIQGFPQEDNFGVIGEYRIAFYDRKNYAIKVLDLEKEITIVENLTATFPTLTAIPEVDRNDPAKQHLLKELNIEFLCLPFSGSLITVEEKSTNNQNQDDYIVTIFKEQNFPNYFAQTVYRGPKGCKISNINNTNKIVIYSQSLNQQEIQFFFWNIEKENGFAVFTIKEPVCGTVIDVKEFESNTIGFFINYAKSVVPVIIKTTIPNELEPPIPAGNIEKLIMVKEELKFDDDDWMLGNNKQSSYLIIGDISYWNFRNNKALINKITTQSTFVLISILNKMKIFTLDCDYDAHFSFSPDGKYFVLYDQFPSEGQQFAIQVHSIINLRSYLMYVMQKLQINQFYSQQVCRDAIEMLTTEDE